MRHRRKRSREEGALPVRFTLIRIRRQTEREKASACVRRIGREEDWELGPGMGQNDIRGSPSLVH